MYQLNLKQDHLEVIPYPSPRMSVRSYRGRLHEYPDHQVPAHWHNDLEFLVIESGGGVYRINGKDYPLQAGQGLFINYNRMHAGFSPSDADFTYSVLQIRPSLLADNFYISEEYLNPLISLESLDCLYLTGEEDWQRHTLGQIAALIELNLERPRYYELETLSGLYAMLQVLCEHMVFREIARNSRFPNAVALMDMTAYIQQHFAEKISLQDIASAGAMCQSKCCSLFQQLLRQSPISYLQNYRIQRSLSLLSHSRMSVTEIAGFCGFNGASYFIEVFRRSTGMTPREFQRRFGKKAPRDMDPERRIFPDV